MEFFLNITKDISSEIIVIYGLIFFIVGLIIFIVLLDKKEKKKITLTKTQELRLMDLRKAEEDYAKEFQRQKEASVTELRPIMQKTMKNYQTETLSIEEEEDFQIDESMYVEDDLEKTSAQLQLEILAKELEKAKEREASKIAKFEEEQEENAIISYHELLKVCDRLYDQNEKVQYMDEGNEPINLDELRSRFRVAQASSEIELLD